MYKSTSYKLCSICIRTVAKLQSNIPSVHSCILIRVMKGTPLGSRIQNVKFGTYCICNVQHLRNVWIISLVRELNCFVFLLSKVGSCSRQLVPILMPRLARLHSILNENHIQFVEDYLLTPISPKFDTNLAVPEQEFIVMRSIQCT